MIKLFPCFHLNSVANNYHLKKTHKCPKCKKVFTTKDIEDISDGFNTVDIFKAFVAKF